MSQTLNALCHFIRSQGLPAEPQTGAASLEQTGTAPL
jgi:hypothetical protein